MAPAAARADPGETASEPVLLQPGAAACPDLTERHERRPARKARRHTDIRGCRGKRCGLVMKTAGVLDISSICCERRGDSVFPRSRGRLPPLPVRASVSGTCGPPEPRRTEGHLSGAARRPRAVPGFLRDRTDVRGRASVATARMRLPPSALTGGFPLCPVYGRSRRPGSFFRRGRPGFSGLSGMRSRKGLVRRPLLGVPDSSEPESVGKAVRGKEGWSAVSRKKALKDALESAGKSGIRQRTVRRKTAREAEAG